jgi:hypothetical protein
MSLLTNIRPQPNPKPDASGFLSSRDAIDKRNREKTLAVLRFLRTSIYSNTEILGHIMALKSKSAISKTLQSMERKRLLRHQLFQEMGGRFTLWGITPTGQDEALQSGEEPINVFFNVSKISLTGLQHYLSLQHIRVRGERANWTDFIYCDRRAVNKIRHADTINDPVRPDLLAVDPNGRRTAIEYERKIKWAPRYENQVIPGHVRRINAGEYDYVVWVCRDADDEKTLRGLLTTAIQNLTKDKVLHLSKTEAGIKPFNITNIHTWPRF